MQARELPVRRDVLGRSTTWSARRTSGSGIVSPKALRARRSSDARRADRHAWRARLRANPAVTGSAGKTKTTGTVVVTLRVARITADPAGRMTSTLVWTRSATRSG